MTVDPYHVHPRSKRTVKPRPYQKLFRDIVPVTDSTARQAHEYRGARRNKHRSGYAMKLKALRIQAGVSRSVFDREMEQTRRKYAARYA